MGQSEMENIVSEPNIWQYIRRIHEHEYKMHRARPRAYARAAARVRARARCSLHVFFFKTKWDDVESKAKWGKPNVFFVV